MHYKIAVNEFDYLLGYIEKYNFLTPKMGGFSKGSALTLLGLAAGFAFSADDANRGQLHQGLSASLDCSFKNLFRTLEEYPNVDLSGVIPQSETRLILRYDPIRENNWKAYQSLVLRGYRSKLR